MKNSSPAFYLIIVFCLTFTLISFIVEPILKIKSDVYNGFKTAGGSIFVYLVVYLARRLSSNKVKNEVQAAINRSSRPHIIISQIFLYLIVVSTVYSFVSRYT